MYDFTLSPISHNLLPASAYNYGKNSSTAVCRQLYNKNSSNSGQHGMDEYRESNGHVECDCCPFGFHIDLDFVRYAEDITSGREQIQNWTSPSAKRTRRFFVSPSPQPFHTTIGRSFSNSLPSPYTSSESFALPKGKVTTTTVDNSFNANPSKISQKIPLIPSSKSAFTFNQKKPDTVPTPPLSILKSKNDPFAQQNDQQASIAGDKVKSSAPSVHFTQVIDTSPIISTLPPRHHRSPPKTTHQSRFRRFQQQSNFNNQLPHYNRRHTFSPPLAYSPTNSAPYLVSSSGRLVGLRLASSTNLSTAPPLVSYQLQQAATRNVNDEIQQILGSQPSITRSTSEYINESSTFSAPTSPVPKAFHTAIAQSMAQIKRLTVCTPSATLAKLTDAAIQLTGTLHKPVLQRQLVLSPEPDVRRPYNNSSVLRTSNLQSRAYFHGGNNSGAPIKLQSSKCATSFPLTISPGYAPQTSGGESSVLRNCGANIQRGASVECSFTSSINFNAFASVRRHRNNDCDESLMDDTGATASRFLAKELISYEELPESKDGISVTKILTRKERSASATSHCENNYFPDDGCNKKQYHPSFTEENYLPNIGQSHLPQLASQHKETSHLTFCETPLESIEKSIPVVTAKEDQAVKVVTSDSIDKIASADGMSSILPILPSLSPPSILHSSGTQTTIVESKVVSTTIDSSLIDPIVDKGIQRRNALVKRITVGTDTADLKKPPSPPPKPTRLMFSELSVEFQYCLGHEPESEWVQKIDAGTETLSLSDIIKSLRPMLVDNATNTDDYLTKLYHEIATQYDTPQPLVTAAIGTCQCSLQSDQPHSQLSYTGVVLQIDTPPSLLSLPSVTTRSLIESASTGPRELTTDEYDEDSEFIIITGNNKRDEKEVSLEYNSNDVLFLSMLTQNKTVVPHKELHAKIEDNCDKGENGRHADNGRSVGSMKEAALLRSTLTSAFSSRSLKSSSINFGQQQRQRSRSSEFLASIQQQKQLADSQHYYKSLSSRSISLTTLQDRFAASVCNDFQPQQQLQSLASSSGVHQDNENLSSVMFSYTVDGCLDHSDNHKAKNDICGSPCLALAGQLLRATPRDDLSAISDRSVFFKSHMNEFKDDNEVMVAEKTNHPLMEFLVADEPSTEFAIKAQLSSALQEISVTEFSSNSSPTATFLTASLPPSAFLSTSAYIGEDNAGNMSDSISVDECSIDTDLQTVVTCGGAASPACSSIRSVCTTTTLSPKASTESFSTTSAQNQLAYSTIEVQLDASITSEAARRTEAIRKLLTETAGLLPVNATAIVAPNVIHDCYSAVSASLLPQSNSLAFQRNSSGYRSYRMEKAKADDLDYITSRHENKKDSPSLPPSTPSDSSKDSALNEMVVLKKSQQQQSHSPTATTFGNTKVGQQQTIPDPIPAKIPRPKFSKYSSLMPSTGAETPEEEAEAADRLTPLRSELRSVAGRCGVGSYARSVFKPSLTYKSDGSVDFKKELSITRDAVEPYYYYENNINEAFATTLSDVDDEEGIVFQEDDFFDDEDEDADNYYGCYNKLSLTVNEERPMSRAASVMGEGEASDDTAETYEACDVMSSAISFAFVANDKDNTSLRRTLFIESLFRDSIDTLVVNMALVLSLEDSKLAEAESQKALRDVVGRSFKYVRHEWLKLITQRDADAALIVAFFDYLEERYVGNQPDQQQLLRLIINFTDQNGNTALHYAVSHENYDVISALLDTRICNVDAMNRAGYSAVMLAALCELHGNDTAEAAIVHRLFHVGNVNAKAVKHAQTALMLSASHGRMETLNLLLECGAEVNVQDVDGSTALMCAAEHGQKEVVRVLLKRPNIDASLTDCQDDLLQDNQTALSIAVENQHRDIAILIYAHLNFSRLEQNEKVVSI